MDARQLERNADRIERKLDLILARLDQQPDRMDLQRRDAAARFERATQDEQRMLFFVWCLNVLVLVAIWL